MSRVLEFSDGAERGDTSWWTSINNVAVIIDTAEVLHGTYCYKFDGPNGNNLAQKTLTTPLSEMYFRMYIKVVADVSDANVIRLRSGNAALVTLTYNRTNARWDITGATTGDTGISSFTDDTWYCLEVYYKISDTVGVLTIRLDGATKFTFSGDTKPGAETTVDNMQFFMGPMYLDDFALDTATWCGLGYYIALTPNAAGDVTQWTPTGAANYQNVSIPANDATYNTGATGQLDNYGMTTITLGESTVERVIPFARASNPAGGTLNVGLKTGGTNYTASAVTYSSLSWLTGSEYAVSPNTSAAWTQTDINNIQFTAEMP